MAERTEGTIVIDAPPPAVMAEIADFEHYTEWAKEIKKAEVLKRDAEKRGKHVAFVVEAPVVGKTEYTLEYTYLPKDAGVSWTWVEGKGVLKNMEGEYALEPAGDATTKVTYRMAMDLAVPLPGFLKRRGEKQVIDVALKGLKKRVESRAS
jgi:uncharacterized membrane protein